MYTSLKSRQKIKNVAEGTTRERESLPIKLQSRENTYKET